MLSQLNIENVAVIEKAQAAFENGLNVLTGETGAGKSILIDSINAILGNRTSRDLVRTGTQKACIRAVFAEIPDTVRSRLEEAGYPVEEELLVYREITAEGKSSCRINGLPATAATLREICGELISIHGQHDSQSLTNPAKHLGVLDAYAQNRAQYSAYHDKYRELIGVKRQLDKLKAEESHRRERIDLLEYQIHEIQSARLQEGESQALEQRRKVVSHAQGILEQLTAAQAALNGQEEFGGAADLLGTASSSMSYAAQLDESLAPYSEKLNELYYAARELAADLASEGENYQFDPAEREAIEVRLDLIHRLKQKYGDSEEEILDYCAKAQQELESIQNTDETLARLDGQLHVLYGQARELAAALTQSRLEAFDRMNREITQVLEFLNMPGIRFQLHHAKGPLAGSGQDTVEFLISANKGEEPKPLAKIASGGELSRIMLAIKSALAEKDDIPTIIYDEIDTGVSGLAAGRIGQVLKRTSKGRQILCITHTARIAAMADRHLLIRKEVEGERTYTKIHQLSPEERVEEIARIISGDQITPTSLANARELIQGGTA